MRIYTATFTQVPVTAVQDLFELLCPSDSVLRIRRVQISQSSDAGDASDEMLSISLKRFSGAPTSGSGGSSATPVPTDHGNQASGATCEVNNTTQISGGSSVTVHSGSFNIRAGYDYYPEPDERPELSPGQYFVVDLNTAPADSLTMDGTITFEELGG